MDASMLDILWIMVSAVLVFFMQAGFAFLETGLTRSKNSINVAVKNLTDLGVSVVCYWIFGFALMFGATRAGLFGTTYFFVHSDGSMWVAAFFLFQAMFCSTAATIVSGAVAERMKYASYIVSTIILSALIYPVFGHWVWGGGLYGLTDGWLARRGFVDFAGSTVVHSIGGWIALAALLIIGPRTGRFADGRRPLVIPGSNIPAAVLGVMILWFGWFGFNGGSTLELNADVAGILVNTALAAAAGMVVALVVGWPIYGRPEVSLLLNGSLAGLVAITAPCAFVDETAAVVIGGVGGIVMLGSVFLLERWRIDDAVGAVPVHLAAGVWGTLAVAIFGDLDRLGTGLSRLQQLEVQSLGVLAGGVWAFGLAFVLLWLINRFMKLRVTPDEEIAGLNVAEHGASTEIFDLYSVMEDQSRTGDLSRRVPVEPFTEVGQIAQRYNGLLDSLQDNLIAKSEYLNILDNVTDGLFLLDSEFRIGTYHSSALETILGRSTLSGERFTRVIADLLPQKTLESVRDFLDLLFDPTTDARSLMRLNPLSGCEFFFDDGKGSFLSKHLEFSFQRIGNAHELRAMVIVRDVTESILLSQEVEQTRQKTQSEMELFYRILHVDPRMLKEFIDSAEQELTTISQSLEDEIMSIADRIHTIYRCAHTLKGDSQVLGLDFLVDSAHALEERLNRLIKASHVDNEDFLPVAIALSELQQTVRRTRGLTERLSHFQDTFVANNVTGTDLIQLSIDRLVRRISEQIGKLVELDYSLFQVQAIPAEHKKVVKDVLIQLTRNSLIHGIELPEERTRTGKSRFGRIRIATETRNGQVVISFRDDGRGIDFESLRQRAQDQGVIAPEVLVSRTPQELVKLIFAEGLSTAERVDKNAGRGVGMALVRDAVHSIGGKMKVLFQRGKYCEFQISIPANGATP